MDSAAHTISRPLAGGRGRVRGELVPEDRGVLGRCPSHPVWERPATRKGALTSLSWAGRGAATDRRPDAGPGRLGQTSGGVLTKAGPLGLPGVLPCNPSQVSAAPFLLLVPSAGHSGATQGILDLGPPRA